ncbi:hypothetical protein DFQ27_003896 [Actinomortierella ambigua]|uniref:Auxin efflux carrier n=1 Tax=Actinomortierella ambigua TaxID=1343610 RepID=A0A9P6Q6M1_9FUNG|nr:hypothetical protein DFQ27_003896 [Actinomortierella ambigua]
MSRVNLYFLTPCLLFVKIASEISWVQFVSYWPIPIFFAIFSFASWLLGSVGSFLLGFTREERNFVIASVMFANTNTLPMALMQSLAFSDAGKSLLRDELDSQDQVAARGFSYILFYAIFGNFVRWSYGFRLLVPQETIVSPLSSFSLSPTTRCRTLARRTFRIIRQLMTPPLVTAMISLVVGVVPILHRTLMNKGSKFYTFLVRPLEDCGAAAIPMIVLCLGAQVIEFSRKGHTPKGGDRGSSPLEPPQPSSPTLPPEVSTRSTLLNEAMAPNGGVNRPFNSSSNNTTVLSLTIPATTGLVTHNATNSTSTTSTASTTVTATIANATAEKHKEDVCCLVDSRRPSQTTLMTGIPPLTAESPPFSSSISSGCRPGERPMTPRSQRSQEEIPPEYQQQARHKIMGPIPFVLLIRLLILPLLSLPIVMYHPRSVFPQMLATDPTFRLALVLLASSPTAINIIQMCQMKGFFEKEMAGVLFWSYCILGVPCVLLWSMVSLWVAARKQ